MARPELPGAAVPHSVACFSISVGGSHPLFQPSAKNALLFFVWLWYIGLGIVKAAPKSSIFLFFLEQLCYFNLSPQGDGNPDCLPYNPYHTNFNLSPQGDGNLTSLRLRSRVLTFQLIPARGRKLEYARVKNNLLVFQLIPVKTLSGAARRLSRRESFSGCHLPCTKLPLSGELARRKP